MKYVQGSRLSTLNSEIFATILFSRIALEDILAMKKMWFGHVLLISVNDRVISPFRGDFIFTKLRMCEVSRKYNLRENFRITVYDSTHCLEYEFVCLRESMVNLSAPVKRWYDEQLLMGSSSYQRQRGRLSIQFWWFFDRTGHKKM